LDEVVRICMKKKIIPWGFFPRVFLFSVVDFVVVLLLADLPEEGRDVMEVEVLCRAGVGPPAPGIAVLFKDCVWPIEPDHEGGARRRLLHLLLVVALVEVVVVDVLGVLGVLEVDVVGVDVASHDDLPCSVSQAPLPSTFDNLSTGL
jgi:hypothetical protein